MQKCYVLYKPVGMTPLQIADKLRETQPELAPLKLGYAGRLDPMAEGILLILVGDENKKRALYEELPKHYTFEVLLGITTDSYDVLGIPTLTEIPQPFKLDEEKLQKYLSSLIGKHMQAYPPFSSKPLHGKPLFYWARQRHVTDEELPSKQIEILSAHFLTQRTVSGEEIIREATERIESVQGNFRQKEIILAWKKLLTPYKNEKFPLLAYTVVCSSGTYVRSLARDLGMFLHSGGLAYSIKRTQVGEYAEKESLRL